MRFVLPLLTAGGVVVFAAGAEPLHDAALPGPLAPAALQRERGPAPAWLANPPAPAPAKPALLPVHERALAFLAEAPPEAGPMTLCFAPDSDPQVVEIFTAALDGHNARANPIGRWEQTATDGGGLQQGQPITLTYSFVPDGTPIPGRTGFSGGPSDLRAYLDGIYGSQAVWKPVFDQVFARWSAVSGINYVYEPNDDGATLHSNPGVPGVRGDLRIAGYFLDGPSNVLAYNPFPEDGDMVFDTGDTFYTIISGNSIRLRNVIAHEHGHGMGLAHVCPIQQTKLMEPFVSTMFDGPQHDDIRGAQWLYGDPFEPDDSPAEALDLGVLANGTSVQGIMPPPAIVSGAVRSIRAAGDQDWLEFAVDSPARLTVSLNPIGLNYDSSAQQCGGSAGSCCSGNFIDSSATIDMGLRILAADGVTVLADADVSAAGTIESLSNFVLPAPGSYYLRLTGTGSSTEAQLYTLSLTTELLTVVPIQISLPAGAPDQLMPGVSAAFDVSIVPNGEAIVADSAQLHYRLDGGAFLSAPLLPQTGDLYTATLPPVSCDDQVEFFVSVEGSETGVATVPALGAAAPFAAAVGAPADVAAFDFETAPGWTVSNLPDGTGTFAGGWQRGVPVDDNRGDPPVDFDGSGQCWLTENDPLDANSDVDSGETILTSPAFDISGLRDVHVDYARWYSNTFGSSPQADTMVIEVSGDNGANWTTLEVVGPTRTSQNPQVDGGWFHRSMPVDAIVGGSTAVRVRFRVADTGSGSVVEAGVDAFAIAGRMCEDVACPCERDGTPGVDVFDLLAYLDLWFAADAAADLDGTPGVDVFDLLAFLDCWFPASSGAPCP